MVLVPGGKHAKVTLVAAHSDCSDVLAPERLQKRGDPWVLPGHRVSWRYFTQGQPPGYGGSLLRTIRAPRQQHSMKSTLYAGISRRNRDFRQRLTGSLL